MRRGRKKKKKGIFKGKEKKERSRICCTGVTR